MKFRSARSGTWGLPRKEKVWPLSARQRKPSGREQVRVVWSAERNRLRGASARQWCAAGALALLGCGGTDVIADLTPDDAAPPAAEADGGSGASAADGGGLAGGGGAGSGAAGATGTTGLPELQAWCAG